MIIKDLRRLLFVAVALLLRIHHELVVDAKPVNRKRRVRKKTS